MQVCTWCTVRPNNNQNVRVCSGEWFTAGPCKEMRGSCLKDPTLPESSSVQFSSVTQSRPTLCDPMNHSTAGLQVYHQLPEFTQTHLHRGGDAIQPSHPLSSPSPPAPIPPSIRVFSNESALHIRWPIVSASASVLLMNTQDWSPLGWTGWISLLSKGLGRVFSSTTIQKHQFFGAQPPSQSNSHIHTWPLEKP